MLSEKIKKHDVKVWLINTGWSGGKYGVGERIDLKSTRAIIDSIHSGELEKAEFQNFPVFNVMIPNQVKNVNANVKLFKIDFKPKKHLDQQGWVWEHPA